MSSPASNAVWASDEWSKLESVIVGRAGNSCFPGEPVHMIQATMPEEHHEKFHSPPRPRNPFPPQLLARADRELDNLAEILRDNGVHVERPKVVDFQKLGGYTAAMARDGLMTIGDKIIEACFAWQCRKYEIKNCFSDILQDLEADGAEVIRAPLQTGRDTIYDGKYAKGYQKQNSHPGTNEYSNGKTGRHEWAINESRPAFDCADFMRFGTTIIGQLSNVTNMAGVEYVRATLPEWCNLELLEVDDPHAMHIDATLLPLFQGLLVYNPERVTEEKLRRHEVFRDWELVSYPYVPTNVGDTELYMTSAWIALNVLSLDENTIIAEENETQFIEFVERFGMTVIRIPFRAVNSIGGSIHCATVDLKRME